MILVDTSAWIELDRATGSPVHHRLRTLIAEGGPIAVTDPIVMEVVAGARDHRRETDLRRLMSTFALIPFDSPTDFDAATRAYLRCRRAGVTPRGMVDCMIAAVAHRSGASVLAADRDLDHVCRVLGVARDEPEG